MATNDTTQIAIQLTGEDTKNLKSSMSMNPNFNKKIEEFEKVNKMSPDKQANYYKELIVIFSSLFFKIIGLK